MNITYCIDDKLGGIASLNQNLIANAMPDTEQRVILIHKLESKFSRNAIQFRVDGLYQFNYSANENLYRVIARLRDLIPGQPGVLVLNDVVEMQMLDHYPVQQTTYQLVHDQYNLGLAKQYPHLVDVFIAHAKHFFDELQLALPDKQDRIFFLPHGVPIPVMWRKPDTIGAPVKLLFLGRMSALKGIFDLPEIARHLRELNVPYQFTCIGNGPDLQALKEKWQGDANVTFMSPVTSAEVLDVCARHDLFVFPTKFEGSPVAMLEAMSCGLVPIVTDLPGGLREIVSEDIGFRVAEGDNLQFAKHIYHLHLHREEIDQKSTAARRKVAAEFDVRVTSKKYHDIFQRYREFFSAKQLNYKKIGSRLDQPMLPGFLTRLVRSVGNKAHS